MAIVCTGSVAYDYLMTFPGYFKDHILPEHLSSISLSFLVDSMVRQRGGVAPNIAYTLALLGERPMVLATVGEDFEDYRAWLEKNSVDTTLVKTINGKYTASFFANTDLSNAQICSFYTGAMADAGQVSIRDAGGAAELVVISPNDPGAMDQYCAECIELGVPYLYDPGQQIVRVSGDSIRNGVMGAQSLFVNNYEYMLLQKHTGLTHAQVLNTVEYLVVTQGEEGALIFVDDREYRIPVVPVEKIADPTGVGDGFRGGFLRGVRLGLDWQTCGQMGALAASYVLEKKGTQNHQYTRSEFVSRYRNHFDDQGALDVLLKD